MNIDDVRVGDTYRLFFDATNPNNRTMHVRAIVDENYYVLRSWSRKYGGVWRYSIEPAVFFKIHFDGGYLKRIAKGEPRA